MLISFIGKSFRVCLIMSVMIGYAFAQEVNKVYLSDLKLDEVVQPYWTPQKDKAITGDAILIDGKAFEKGIGTLSSSSMYVFLNGEGISFDARVGLQDNARITQDVKSNALSDGNKLFYTEDGNKKNFVGIGNTTNSIANGSVVFVIKADGNEVWKSRVLKGGSAADSVRLDIKGIKILELKVEDAGDGISGDNAVWADPIIEYNTFKPVLVDEGYLGKVAAVDADFEKYIEPEIRKLPLGSEALVNGVKKDWLISKPDLAATIFRKAGNKDIVMSNGLVSRTFRLSPNCVTTEFNNLTTGERLLRGVSPEAILIIDGKEYAVGGLDGQKEYAYLKTEWLEEMYSTPGSFQLVDFSLSPIKDRIKWPGKRWSLAGKDPMKGKSISFKYEHPAFKGLEVYVHYNIYDGIPLISKWITIENRSEKEVTLDHYKSEVLAFVEAESAVERGGDYREWELPNIHIESDYAFHAMSFKGSNKVVHWKPDPRYTSQANYPLKTPCLLECELPLGPAEVLKRGASYESFRLWEMPFDSFDKQRQGLFTNAMYKLIAPWTTENPLFLHLTTTDDKKVKAAIDQCVDTGYEMVILSFGSGLNMEDTSEANIAKFKALADYAHERGIELGGYSLLSSRWISDEVDVINPETGKRGGTIHGSSPCLNSQWGIDYFEKLKTFFERTGMDLLEHDGSYPGQFCASTTHVGHKGLEDSQWKAWKRISDFYKWCNENNISLNIPDWYYLSGSNKNGIGYREVNWSLPRERQLVIGRQNMYDGTYVRLPGMSWTFVPLTQYHGGGAAATIEPLDENLVTYEAHMIQNYGMGIQACYRGPRLYDTERTKAKVIEVVNWYKKYREILNSPIIHLIRANGQTIDGFMHVNPDLKQKGFAMFFNPTDAAIRQKLTLPLYYTGLDKEARISIEGGPATKYKLSRDYSVETEVNIPAGGYIRMVIE